MNVEDKFGEQVVIGGVLLDERVLEDVMRQAAPSDFYHPANETILEAMHTMSREGRPIDCVTVGDHLEREGSLSRVGGRAYLHECSQSVPVAMNAPYYAQIVRDESNRRALRMVGNRLLQSTETGDDVTHTLAAARREVDSVTLLNEGAMGASLATTVAKALESLNQPISLRTPWRDMNRTIAGWMPGMLYVAGARPGVGKSSLLTCAGPHAAQRGKGTAILFSLEMGASEMSMRMMVNHAEVDGQRVLHRSTRDGDDERLAEAGRAVSQMDLIIEQGEWTVESIRSRVKECQSRFPVAFVGIDYLQEIKAPRGEIMDEHVRIARDAQALKNMATELDVPVLALAQLNREIDQRTVKMPSLSDLKGSSGIEAAADVVMLMHRVSQTQEEAGMGDSTDLDVTVAKNRQGPQDFVRLKYDGRYFRVMDRPGPYD